MSDTQVIKFDVGSRYILIVKQELTTEEKSDLIRSIDQFLNDGSIQMMVLQGIDCTLEKVELP